GHKWRCMGSSINSHRNIISNCGERRNTIGCSAALMEAAASKQTSLKVCAERRMNLDDLRQRSTPLGISSEQFRKLGYRLIDQIADHFETLGGRPLTSGKSPEAVRRVTGSEKSLPLTGTHPGPLLE